MQNYEIDNNTPLNPAKGVFYNTYGLMFVLIFLFIFQFVFYFISIYSAAAIYGIGVAEVKNLISQPDGTAMAINIARFTNVVTFTGYMLLPSLIFIVLNRRGIKTEAGLGVKIQGSIIFLGVLILALAIPLVDFFTGFLQNAPLPQSLKFYADYFENSRTESLNTILDMQRPVELVFCIFALGLLPALFEELMFRGVILNIFKNISQSTWFPVLIQAFIFTALHFSIYEFPGILLMGIIFGYMAIKTGTIIYGIILHFLFNSVSIVLSYMNQRAFDATGVYGKYQSLSLGPWLAIAAFAGIVILFRLFQKTLKENHE